MAASNSIRLNEASSCQVFETETLRPQQRFQMPDVISSVTWSNDSNLILIGVNKRGAAFARNVYDPSWNCKVDEGLAGLSHCRWSPSGRHILTISEMRLRLTIWNLVNQSVQYVPCPKHGDSAGIDFNQDGTLMAVILKNTEDTVEQVVAGAAGGDVIALFDS